MKFEIDIDLPEDVLREWEPVRFGDQEAVEHVGPWLAEPDADGWYRVRGIPGVCWVWLSREFGDCWAVEITHTRPTLVAWYLGHERGQSAYGVASGGTQRWEPLGGRLVCPVVPQRERGE